MSADGAGLQKSWCTTVARRANFKLNLSQRRKVQLMQNYSCNLATVSISETRSENEIVSTHQ